MILICLHTAMESAARNNWASDKHQSRIGTTQQEQDPVECQQVQRATAWAERFQRLLCQQRGVRGIQTGTRLSWPPARPISSAACRRPGLWPPLFGQVLSPDSCSMELLCGLVASPLSLWSSSTTHLPQQKIPHFGFGRYPKHLHSVQRNKDWLEYWLNTIQRYLTFNTISRTFAEFYLFFKNIFLILQVASRYS